MTDTKFKVLIYSLDPEEVFLADLSYRHPLLIQLLENCPALEMVLCAMKHWAQLWMLPWIATGLPSCQQQHSYCPTIALDCKRNVWVSS